MRILIVVRKITMGGLQKQTLSLAKIARQNDHEVHLMILKSEKASKELEIPQDIFVHRPNFHQKQLSSLDGLLNYISSHYIKPLFYPHTKDLYTGFSYSKYFTEEFNQLENQYGAFDLIFFRGQGCFEFVHQFNHPHAYCFIDGKPYEYKGRKAQYFNSLIYAKPKKFICVSNQLKEELLKIEPHAQAICSHNLIDVEEIKALANQSVDQLPENYIVNVGRLVKVKSQALLIEALKFLPDDLKLILVGDGNTKNELMDLISKLKLSDRVIFVGNQNNPYPYIKHAKALVHTSQKEGFGLIFLESLILDTPIVAAESIGGMRDLLKGEVLEKQIVPRDPKLIAQKIIETLKSPYHSNPCYYEDYEAHKGFKHILEQIKELDHE